MENVADLSAALQRSKGKPLPLELLRDGTRQKIEVTPEKRPTEFNFSGEALRNDAAAMSEWLERQAGGTPRRNAGLW